MCGHPSRRPSGRSHGHRTPQAAPVPVLALVSEISGYEVIQGLTLIKLQNGYNQVWSV
jgi:hypothetical protein